MDVLVTCKYKEDPIKYDGARVDTTFSPLYPYGSYLLVQNLMQSIPHPNDASDKNLVTIGTLVAEIFEFENVYARTDERTDDGSTGIL